MAHAEESRRVLLLRSPPSASGGAGGLAGEGELRTVQKCPRRTHLLPGLTQGSKPSHGICASYSKPGWFDQGEPTGMAAVFAQRMRPRVSSTAVQPALLPAAGLPAGIATLAGGEASTQMPGETGGTAEARRGGTAATCQGVQAAGEQLARRDRPRGVCGFSGRRVVTQQQASGNFLRSAWMLRAPARCVPCVLLRPGVRGGHAAGGGP